jgi:CubicO group peptidase (beta-lactamase class C family)
MHKTRYLVFAIFLLIAALVSNCNQTEFESGTAEKSNVAIPGESAEAFQIITSPSPSYTQASTNTPSPTVTETPTTPPTRTPIPTTAPYDKIPEQTDDGWEVASLIDAGINPIRIGRMLESIYHGQKRGETPFLPNGMSKYQNIHSILIIKDERLVFEEYFYDYGRDYRHDLASITKSITSLLVGSTIEQGYLEGVGEKVLPFFPEYLPLEQPDERAENITIENLLTMRSGWECDDWNPASRTYYLKMQPTEIATILNFPMKHQPGFAFSYCTSGTAVLNAIIAKASGMELSQFASQSMLEPLGIQDVIWDGINSFGGFGGILLMRPRDMARIGLLALLNGDWQGEQIIPKDWIQQSVQKHIGLPYNQTWGNGYGYLWWLSDVQCGGTKIHSFTASGHGGQVITIFPELEMVVVITGSNYQNDEGQPFQIMERFILPATLGY